MQADPISSQSSIVLESGLRQIISSAVGDHESTDNAIAVITTFIKTLTTLVQLLPNLTSIRHSNELMKKYVSSCQAAIQAESLAILQSKYSTELSNIPEELSLSNQGSPIRSASPDLKIPQLRAKTAPRHSLLQPTRRSLTMVRRKSVEPDMSLSASCFRMNSSSSVDPGSNNIPLHPTRSNLSAQLRRSKTLDVSRSVDLSAAKRSSSSYSFAAASTPRTTNERSKRVASARRLTEGNITTRRNSDIQQLSDASIDVSRSVDWGSFTSSTSSSNAPNDDLEIDDQVQKQTKVKAPSRTRSLLSRLLLTDSEKRRASQAEAVASKENEKRNSEFLQNVEELVAKSSPYDEVFATRTKILNE